PIRAAAVLRAAIGQNTPQRNVMALKERDYAVVEHLGTGQRRLALVEVHYRSLAVRVDKGLLVNAAHAFERADVERILRPAIPRTLARKLAGRFLIGFGLF